MSVMIPVRWNGSAAFPAPSLAGHATRPEPLRRLLGRLVFRDGCADLRHDRFRSEARTLLRWRKLDGRFRLFHDRVLHLNKAPERVFEPLEVADASQWPREIAGGRFTARRNARTLVLCGVILVDDGSAAAMDEKARPC